MFSFDDFQHQKVIDGKMASDSDRQVLVLREVTDTLNAAWKLPEAQRRKIIRRLLLRWHPDKNLGDEEFATTITQHIRAEVESHRALDELPDGITADVRNPFAGTDSFQRNFATAFRFFFDQMNERAHEHRAQRERYREHFAREYSSSSSAPSGSSSSSNIPPPTFASCNPQPAQAKRFLRQAREDLSAADNDLDGAKPAFEWVSFKVYQAAKKALKAAQLYINAVPTFSHDIVILAASLDDAELRQLARQLQQLVGDATCRKIYAPDPIDYAIIPHDEHTEQQARGARLCARDVLRRVADLIEMHD
jgi:sacsin